MDEALLRRIGELVQGAGGRALLVGGCVRDRVLGQAPKDHDIEVFGLDAPAVARALAPLGAVMSVGSTFVVQRIRGLDIDFSLPRDADFTSASRQRDLTMNSMGQDLLTQEILDPHGGRQDLQNKVLRATDVRYFGTDPLRGMRVAQLAARFDMQPDAELRALCRGLDLSLLPAERLLEEFRKLLLKAPRPSVGLAILEQTQLLRFFPELQAMCGVPQDPHWHPEGDVWTHTCMVVDEAAALRTGGPGDFTLMLSALLHDVGKPASTATIDGRVRSGGHDVAGVPLAVNFLTRLRASTETVQQVSALVRHHLAPAMLVQGGAKDKAYRRLIRDLQAVDLSVADLAALARADHLGRTTADALARRFAAGDTFMENVARLGLAHTRVRDVVQGRDLLARGYKPGPAMGALLDACREVQDETGWEDANCILDRVLAGS